MALRGILNATANHILTLMAAGRSYTAALADAQAQGYAEPDPSAELTPQTFEEAARNGQRVKLVATASGRRGWIAARLRWTHVSSRWRCRCQTPWPESMES